MKDQEFCCVYCGKKSESYVDISMDGGDDDPEFSWNMACIDCLYDGKVFSPEALKRSYPQIYEIYLKRKKEKQ